MSSIIDVFPFTWKKNMSYDKKLKNLHTHLAESQI
jgi:hypothetical protein